MGQEQPTEGTARVSEHNAIVGYFEQDQANALDLDKTVIQTMEAATDATNYEGLRALLGRFMFKVSSTLSSGERWAAMAGGADGSSRRPAARSGAAPPRALAAARRLLAHPRSLSREGCMLSTRVLRPPARSPRPHLARAVPCPLLSRAVAQNDDVDKKVAMLSGGEKGRLALCRMMLTPCNVLILVRAES